VAEPNILKKGAEDNSSALSSFIADAHNEIYAFYTEKTAFFIKNMSRPHRPLNPQLVTV